MFYESRGGGVTSPSLINGEMTAKSCVEDRDTMTSESVQPRPLTARGLIEHLEKIEECSGGVMRNDFEDSSETLTGLDTESPPQKYYDAKSSTEDSPPGHAPAIVGGDVERGVKFYSESSPKTVMITRDDCGRINEAHVELLTIPKTNGGNVVEVLRVGVVARQSDAYALPPMHHGATAVVARNETSQPTTKLFCRLSPPVTMQPSSCLRCAPSLAQQARAVAARKTCTTLLAPPQQSTTTLIINTKMALDQHLAGLRETVHGNANSEGLGAASRTTSLASTNPTTPIEDPKVTTRFI